MRKSPESWALALLLFMAEFMEVQQQSQPQFTRHFFVPARQQVAQQLRSRAIPTSDKRFQTITMSSGREFVLVPKKLFMQQRQIFARQRPHVGGFTKAQNHQQQKQQQPQATTTKQREKGPLRARQVRPQQQRRLSDLGAVVPQLRSLSTPTQPVPVSVPQAKQLPQTQFTQKQIPVSRRQQKPTTPIIQQPLTKTNVPPKLVAEILVAKQQKESSSSEKLTSEAERKAQQKELQRLREQIRPGKSRSKSEKSSKGDEKERERARELLAIQRQRTLNTAERQKLQQIFRERTFSMAPTVSPLAPTTAATTPRTPHTNRPFPSPPPLPITPSPSTPSSTTTHQNPPVESSVILVTTTTMAVTSSSSPAPPTSILQTASFGSTSAPLLPQLAAGPPGQQPPSDNVVAELNNASDFMEVAHRLRLRELFARRSLL